jgi:hypothetical protein
VIVANTDQSPFEYIVAASMALAPTVSLTGIFVLRLSDIG